MRIFQRKRTQSFGRTQRNIDKSVNTKKRDVGE